MIDALGFFSSEIEPIAVIDLEDNNKVVRHNVELGNEYEIQEYVDKYIKKNKSKFKLEEEV